MGGVVREVGHLVRIAVRVVELLLRRRLEPAPLHRVELAGLVDGADVRMVELRRRLGLPTEPHESTFRDGTDDVDDLERDATPHRLDLLREENIDTEKNFFSLFNAINAMAEKYDMPILYSCHPRSRNRLAASGFQLDPRVQVQQPLGFHDYNCLQMNAFAVVSDSGTLPEESSFFTSVGHPFPAVCIRTSTERPESLDKAGFILSGIDTNGLLQSVDTAVELVKNGDYGIPVPNYTDENVSTKVVKIIQSYVGVVNKMVWRKF